MFRLLLFLSLGIAAVSTASIFIKLCAASALIIAAYRMVFASLMLIPFAGYQKVWKGWNRAEIGWLTCSGFFRETMGL